MTRSGGKVKQPKQLRLYTKGKKNNLLQFKCSTEKKEYYQSALDKLNKIAIINFTLSDLCRMSMDDLSTRIINEKITVDVKIPERKITFDLVKSKSRNTTT